MTINKKSHALHSLHLFVQFGRLYFLSLVSPTKSGWISLMSPSFLIKENWCPIPWSIRWLAVHISYVGQLKSRFVRKCVFWGKNKRFRNTREATWLPRWMTSSFSLFHSLTCYETVSKWKLKIILFYVHFVTLSNQDNVK